jgi:hypothetical protein
VLRKGQIDIVSSGGIAYSLNEEVNKWQLIIFIAK